MRSLSKWHGHDRFTGRTPHEYPERLPTGYHGLVIGYIATKCKWTPAYANAVTADALRFLAVCADHPGERLVSSEDVDEVVDTFVLDTELLRWLEAGLGREVVHTPSYAHDPIERARANTAYTVTMEYMRRSGPVDPHIWRDFSGAYGPCSMATCFTTCRLSAT
jgi:hypothetical protein